MSDPVTRRSRIIKSLRRNMSESSEGWTLDEIVLFLVRAYEYGIRPRTARNIVEQLAACGVLYEKGLRWYVKKDRG